jgi:preprotein translocase subunit SecG
MASFIILCILLSFFILIQQGKGDIGIGMLGGTSQTLFGGSGGQEFFVKTTWVLGSLFLAGALGISILRTTLYQSQLSGFKKQVVPLQVPGHQAPGEHPTHKAPLTEGE